MKKILIFSPQRYVKKDSFGKPVVAELKKDMPINALSESVINSDAASIVEFMQRIFCVAAEKKASDIHFESQLKKMKIRWLLFYPFQEKVLQQW